MHVWILILLVFSKLYISQLEKLVAVFLVLSLPQLLLPPSLPLLLSQPNRLRQTTHH